MHARNSPTLPRQCCIGLGGMQIGYAINSISGALAADPVFLVYKHVLHRHGYGAIRTLRSIPGYPIGNVGDSVGDLTYIRIWGKYRGKRGRGSTLASSNSASTCATRDLRDRYRPRYRSSRSFSLLSFVNSHELYALVCMVYLWNREPSHEPRNRVEPKPAKLNERVTFINSPRCAIIL